MEYSFYDIVSKFNDQPNKIAIETDYSNITYEELFNRVDSYSKKIEQVGLLPGSKVIVHMSRGPEYIITILSLSKLGITFVPIDITYPKERIDFIQNDCQANGIITDYKYDDLTVVDLDELTRFLSFEDSVKVKLPTEFGDFDLQLFEDEFNKEHLIISKGNLTSEEPLLIRVHSECLTGDIFASHRCDCGEQLHAALQKISELGRGAILYLRQEGRGIGLRNKLLAYQLQEQGVDTYDANVQLGFAPDERDYSIAVDILDYLGIKSVKLLTNNPDKVEQLSSLGINIVDREPIKIKPHKENKHYLQTKKIKFKGEKTMKKLTFIITLALSTLLFAGCIDRTTSNGGEKSLTNNISYNNYQFSQITKSEIEKSKEKIILTELIDGTDKGYTRTATDVASFIQSVNKQMEENGYTIISSDTNGQGSHGDKIFVTLIFAKK